MLLLATCSNRTDTLRYRLTIEIETPDGVRSGSAVQEIVNHAKIPWLPGGDSYRAEWIGEAVAIDLPGGTLFHTGSADWLLGVALQYGTTVPAIDTTAAKVWPQSRPDLIRALRSENAEVVLVPEQVSKAVDWTWFRMIRFADIADPTTLRRIRMPSPPASFESGFRVRRIRFKVTKDPLTDTITQRLPWLNDLKKYRRHPDNRFSNTISQEALELKSGMEM